MIGRADCVTPQTRRHYGTAGPFSTLFTEALKADTHVFAAESGTSTFGDATHRLRPPERVASNVLDQHSVEVLAIEETSRTTYKGRKRYWVKWTDKCTAVVGKCELVWSS
jgi:predicted helicase